MRAHYATAARFAGAAAILAITLYLIDVEAVWHRLRNLDSQWLVLGVFLAALNYCAVAVRWWAVARRFEVPLSPGRALADYVLGGFANQALPTGLAGAALRAVRHGKRKRDNGEPVGAGTAIAIVVLERLDGLAVLALAALCGAIALVGREPHIAAIAAGAVLGLAGVSFGVFSLAAKRSAQGRDGFVAQARHALIADGAWLWQLLSSASSVALLGSGFFCAAQASGVDVTFVRALIVTPLILASMVIPLAIAGWGIREAAAAGLFAAMGLDASTGVAVSVSFGLISLVASLPGAIVWLVPEPRSDGSGNSSTRGT